MDGHWEKGPEMDLFWALERNLGRREVIAEDLGLMTPSVEQLVRDSRYPNMKVLEFAFEPGKKTGYLPHEYDKNCVVYTGTHDNDTIVSWYQELEDDERQFLNEYMDNEESGSKRCFSASLDGPERFAVFSKVVFQEKLPVLLKKGFYDRKLYGKDVSVSFRKYMME